MLMSLIVLPIVAIPLSAFLEQRKRINPFNLQEEHELEYKLINLEQHAPARMVKISNILLRIKSVLKVTLLDVHRYHYQKYEDKYILLFSKQTDILINDVRSQFDNIYIYWSRIQPTDETLIYQGYYYKLINTNIFFNADIRLREIKDDT